jgi:hypothetical protein
MTLSIKIKELMVLMPDTLNTKKEVDDYYKDAMKKCVEKKKGNDDNKPKKELNAYQKFMKENIKTVKEQNPKLTGPEVFSMIATLWKKEKEENTTDTAGAAAKDKKETVASAAPAAAASAVVPAEEEDTEVSVDTANKVKEEVAAVAVAANEEVVAVKEAAVAAAAKKKDKKTK